MNIHEDKSVTAGQSFLYALHSENIATKQLKCHLEYELCL